MVKKNKVFLFLPVIGGSPHVEHRRALKQTENILFLLWIKCIQSSVKIVNAGII